MGVRRVGSRSGGDRHDGEARLAMWDRFTAFLLCRSQQVMAGLPGACSSRPSGQEYCTEAATTKDQVVFILRRSSFRHRDTRGPSQYSPKTPMSRAAGS